MKAVSIASVVVMLIGNEILSLLALLVLAVSFIYYVVDEKERSR